MSTRTGGTISVPGTLKFYSIDSPSVSDCRLNTERDRTKENVRFVFLPDTHPLKYPPKSLQLPTDCGAHKAVEQSWHLL